jgi:RND family efflux transporter MFP subunit
MKNLLNFFKRFWWLILIGFLIGGFVTYKSTSAKSDAIKQKSYVIKKSDLVDSLAISGQIDAHEKANLQFQTSGMLAWVGVKEGDYVKKFQVVASLDKRLLKNQMSQLLNNYMTNRWTFEQAQADNVNWQTNGMTQIARDTVKRTLEKNQFSLNNAVLNVEAEDLTMQFANLWSPIEGLVTSIDTPNSGVNVTPASANFSIINPKTVYFSSTADQTEVTKFNIGQKGKLVLDAFPDEEFDTEVESIGFTPKAGETGTVYELKLKVIFDNAQYKFKMGMTGDVNFIFREDKNVLSVPEGYIIKDSGKTFLSMMINNKLERVEIKTGITIDGNTEILSGVSENDVIYY